MENERENFLGKITDFFIERYRVAYLFIATILIIGGFSYINLPREEMPEMVFPYVIINTSYIGAAPQEVENLITDEIEGELKALEDVEQVTSSSSNGISSIMIEFEIGIDIDEKKDEVNSIISEIKNDLPDDSNYPRVMSFESSDKPMMELNVIGDYDLITLKNIAENIQDEIKKVEGIDEVTVVGGRERVINIYIEPAKLAKYNISNNQIMSAISDFNVNSPGGSAQIDTIEYNIRTIGGLENIEEIKNLIVTTINGNPIFLKDIAEVKDTYEEVTSYSQTYDTNINTDKKVTSCVTLSITREQNGDIIGPSNSIKKLIKDEKGDLYPDDVIVSVINDEAVNVGDTLNDVVGNAISGLLVVIVVLFLFIGFRESLIVAFVIPMSLLASFGVMMKTGITFNSMSLVALIIALGMLVDNAIVIMENIDRIRDEGEEIYQASRIGAKQVVVAVFASTLTTMCAFYPLSTLPGIMGEFLATIPTVVIYAIGASFIMSVVVTPALCSRFLSKHKEKMKKDKGKVELIRKITSVVFVFALSLYAFSDDLKFGLLSWIAAIIFSSAMGIKQFKSSNSQNKELWVITKYKSFLSSVLKSKIKRISIMILAFVVFIGSLLTIPAGILKVSLLPESDTTSLTIDIETPSGYVMNDTAEIVTQVEDRLFSYEEIESFVSKVGNTGSFISTNDSSNVAQISVELIESKYRDRSSMEIIDVLRGDLSNIAGAQIKVSQSEFGPQSGSPINVKLIGEDLELLNDVSEDLKNILEETEGTTEVERSVDGGTPELQIIIDKEKARLLGLTSNSIGNEIRSSFNGVSVSTINDGNDEIDLVLRTRDEEINTMMDFNKIYFTSANGSKVAFSQVAKIVEADGLGTIDHEDFETLISVQADVKNGYNTNDVLNNFKDKISNYKLPNGVQVSYGGDAKTMEESFTDMSIGLMIAILLVYIVLTVQFNSLTHPLVILVSVPLATIGAIGGLIITNNSFGMFAFMGVIALVGIAVNDAIVLVDFINYLRKKGYEIKDAIVESGKTRFQPVFATSITTIGGILPLALKEPEYAQMGFALIFGLVASTVLTLLVIPVVYSIFEQAKEFIQKRIPVFVDRR